MVALLTLLFFIVGSFLLHPALGVIFLLILIGSLFEK